MYCPHRSKLRRAAHSRSTRATLCVSFCERCQLNPTERGRLLRTYPVLQELPAHLLKKVEAAAKPVHAPAGQRLFGDGSPCTYYPLLIEGTIRASKVSPEGHEILLYRLNPGESCVITVVTLLGEVSYPAIGTAETELVLFAVPRSVFLEIDPGVPSLPGLRVQRPVPEARAPDGPR